MPEDDAPDTDRTPVEPILERRKSSRNMLAIGWVLCPACKDKPNSDCGLCWDDERKEFCRRVPVDVALRYKPMNTTVLPVGSKGVDTITRLSQAACRALRDSGIDFVVRYLPTLTLEEIGFIGGANLAFTVVTYANSFDPSDEIAQLSKLGIPRGADVWLDVEGVTDDAVTLQQRINMWARAIKAAGWTPKMYDGSQALLTSDELYALAVVGYWHSCSRVVDRFGKEAAPSCGWQMHQLYPPNLTIAGVQVDIDFIQEDYRGRPVTFVSV